MAKEKETENRSERERFLDCMLKEILSGQRNPGDRLPTESELAEQYGLRKTNVHLGLQELERLGFLKVVPRHATYVAPYWEQANLETLAAIMTHGGKPQPELVDAFLELREMVALGWFRWTGRNPKTEQMRHLYGLLERMEAIAYAPDGEKDNPEFLDLVNQFLVCMFAESDNMIFRVLLRSSRELAHVTYYIVAYTLDTQERDLFENIAIPVPAAQIEFVLVTHAHMDHTGHLPLLYKQGFRGTVYATEATCDLCGIMLRDAAHIQMSEAEWKGRKAARAGQPAPEPLYTLEDVEGVLRLLRPCGYGKRIQVGENIIIRFTDVGHLLGSACIEAWLTEGGTEKKIVFSGDIGNTDQPIIRDPQTVSGADYVLIESTYGDRSHGPRVDYLTALADCIQRTLDRGGNVVIPSFAVGRTQELLYFIRQIKDAGMVHGHPHFPVYVDSPLANEATRVFLQTDTSFLDDEACALIRSGINPLYFDDLHTAVTKEDSMALNTDKTPKVILSSSGMCDAGRIRHHLKYNLWRPECTVLFVGYQAVGTLGRKLHDGAESVKIFGDEIAVHAEITVLPGVSGHADKQGLLGWINAMEQKPAHVFVNHGDDDACTAFAACLRDEYGYDADAPYSGSEFDLAAGAYTYVAPPRPIRRDETRQAAAAGKRRESPAYARLQRALGELTALVRRCAGCPNKGLSAFAEELERLTARWRDRLAP